MKKPTCNKPTCPEFSKYFKMWIIKLMLWR